MGKLVMRNWKKERDLWFPMGRTVSERATTRQLWKRVATLTRRDDSDQTALISAKKDLRKRVMGERAWLADYLRYHGPVPHEPEARERLRQLDLGRKSWLRPPFTGAEIWMLC